jgi:hypothetical protein
MDYSEPHVSWEIRDEVEMYARESGRHGTLHYAPNAGWFVRFTLRDSDPRMSLIRDGSATELFEDVWFVRTVPGGRPFEVEALDVQQMGASGVREFLERGNTWSGRGEFSSLEDALRQTRSGNESFRDRNRTSLRDQAVDRALDQRRSRLGIPYLPVGVSLGESTNHHKES